MNLRTSVRERLRPHPRLYTALVLAYDAYLRLRHRKERLAFRRHMKELASAELHEIRRLAAIPPAGCRGFLCENEHYGNREAVERLLGTKVRGYVEHGLYLGEFVPDRLRYMPFETIYTYGPYRKRVLEAYLREHGLKKKIVTAGPYILGAPSYYPDAKIRELRKRRGKTLLFFPSHSIEDLRARYRQEETLDLLHRLRERHRFETVTVCFYWNDLLEGRDTPYRKRGFEIVTAGHREDPRFLSRLRTIIELSDMTASNGLGTHLGYCVALGKAHYLMRQEVRYEGPRAATERERGERWRRCYAAELERFRNAFGTYRETITPRQKDLVEYFWGAGEAPRKGGGTP
jgi:hypothetical protein